MDALALVIVSFLLVWAWFNVVNPRKQKLPPGPYPFPIIGNILQLGANPHQSFAKLSKTYGPLMSLQLGTQLTVVASSPDVAKQILQQHDQVLSNRTVIAAAEAHGYHKSSMVFLPAGNKWRKLRKIWRENMFSAQRLDESRELRLEKLRILREYVRECCIHGRAINIVDALFITTVNIITTSLFSVDFITNFDSDVTQDIKEAIQRVLEMLGAPSLVDFFPILKPMDPEGIMRQSEFYFGKIFDRFEDEINQRLQSSNAPNKYHDLLETLLHLKDENLSINDMKVLFMDLFLGGSDTTPNTVEWAMTHLLLSPEKMTNATNELRSVIGKNEQVEESDMSRLPYLQAVIKETLRLHPPVSLLAPHKADQQVEINGYTIPKNAQIFVNLWAIGRDSSVWPNPTSFEPERFLNCDIDFKGQDFELISFGSGRRICPGSALAHRMLPLMLASLIHNFDWKLQPQHVETSDKFGIAVRKAVPLMAIPIEP